MLFLFFIKPTPSLSPHQKCGTSCSSGPRWQVGGGWCCPLYLYGFACGLSFFRFVLRPQVFSASSEYTVPVLKRQNPEGKQGASEVAPTVQGEGVRAGAEGPCPGAVGSGGFLNGCQHLGPSPAILSLLLALETRL